MKKMWLRSSYWIVGEEDTIIFGRGRMKILQSIAETGSINRTAKNLNMSYKTVWSKIRSTEEHLGAKIVHADRKTGTRLTTTGKRLVERFELLQQQCRISDDQIFEELFRLSES